MHRKAKSSEAKNSGFIGSYSFKKRDKKNKILFDRVSLQLQLRLLPKNPTKQFHRRSYLEPLFSEKRSQSLFKESQYIIYREEPFGFFFFATVHEETRAGSEVHQN
jgi:hypothetical protein